jgi:hypothetical protein
VYSAIHDKDIMVPEYTLHLIPTQKVHCSSNENNVYLPQLMIPDMADSLTALCLGVVAI